MERISHQASCALSELRESLPRESAHLYRDLRIRELGIARLSFLRGSEHFGDVTNGFAQRCDNFFAKLSHHLTFAEAAHFGCIRCGYSFCTIDPLVLTTNNRAH